MSAPNIHVHPHSVHSEPTLPSATTEEEEHDYEALPVGHGWATNMAAGAMAGISEHAAIFPVDSIKVLTPYHVHVRSALMVQTRMQVLPSLVGASASTAPASAAASAGAAAAARPATTAALTTFSQHLRSVSTGEGVRTLWRGVASVIMGAGPAHAAHFGMYEFVREIAGGRGDGWQGVAGTAVAGAAGTITSDALMNPFDVIKQRMQIRNSPYTSVWQCFRSVYRAEGLTAFYVSYPTTLTMTVPFTAVQFSAYESLKGVLNPEGTYSPSTHIIAGGVAGGLAAAVTTPLDVAKTRGSSTDPRIRNARGMAEALSIIKERDGWRGLRRGMGPRIMTVAPSTAISWLSYEFFKVLIRQHGTMPESGQTTSLR